MNPRGFLISRNLFYDAGEHPQSYADVECGFAAECLSQIRPETVLDIGSYRHFVIGLLASHRVISIDVRKREPFSNETVLVCDAKALDLRDASVDAVTSLCSLEHFGLGRYGDELDQGADLTAFREMVRVLRPGGHLIFSTTITSGKPRLEFNANRVYDYEMLRQQFIGSLALVKERFYRQDWRRFCTREEVSGSEWNVYMALCRKPGGLG